MNRLKLFFLSLLINLFFGCTDIVKFEEENLHNNAWLEVFTPKIQTINGTHDLDNSRLTLILKSKLKSSDYFNTIEKNALDNGWSLSFKKDEYRIFIKDMPFATGLPDPVIVKICQIESNLYSIEVY